MTGAQTAIIVVTDLVDSTAKRSTIGEDAAEDLRRVHDRLVFDAVAAHGGLVVKHLGDGVLARFNGAADAVAAAVTIEQDTAGQFDVRVGISAGDVTIEDDDCFGAPVIEASRLCATAGGGQILIAEVARLLARGRGGHQYGPPLELDLKGLPEPVTANAVLWEPRRPTGIPLPSALQQPERFPFAGRAEALETASKVWAEVIGGRRRVLLVSGEPGVGKTRLAVELCRTVHVDDSATVLFGRAEDEVSSPYRPFAQAMQHLVTHVDDELLAAHVEEWGRSLDPLANALSHRHPESSVPAGTPEELRAALFDATVDLLRRAAQVAPVVLVLDDLHWADGASLAMLKHLTSVTADDRILVVGTYRGTDLVRGHPLSAVLADLRRISGVGRIALDGLDGTEVSQLIELVRGESLETSDLVLAQRVADETGGNPFFVGEILVHLNEAGAIYRRDGRWHTDTDLLDQIGVPEGIREVIGRRLDSLAPEVIAVLQTAAVIGQEFDLRVLAMAAGLDEDDVASLLEGPLARGLLTEVVDVVDRLRFPHALIKQTLSEEVSTSRRVRLHGKVADAMLVVGRGTSAERVSHLLEAAAVTPADELVEAVLDLVPSLERNGAWETAVGWIDRALEVLADTGDRPDLETKLLYEKGAQLIVGGRVAAARDALFPAAERARSAGDTATFIDIVLRYSIGGALVIHGESTGLALIDEADKYATAQDEATAAKLMAARAGFHSLDADPAAFIRCLQRSGEVADRVGDDQLALRTKCDRLTMLKGSPSGEDLAQASLDVIRFAPAQVTTVAFALEHLFLAGLKQGDLDAAARTANDLAEHGRVNKRLNDQDLGRLCLAIVAALRGRFDEAENEVTLVRGRFGYAGESTARDSTRLTLALLKGDVDTARRVHERWSIEDPFFPPLIPIEIRIAGFGAAAGAPEVIDATTRWTTEVLPTVPFWYRARSIAGLGPALRHAEPAVAASLARTLDPFASSWMAVGATVPQGHAGWVLGWLQEAVHDLDAAISHYEQALASHHSAGEVPLRAHYSVDLARALAARGGVGDRDRAKHLADEVLATATEVGLIGVDRQVAGLGL